MTIKAYGPLVIVAIDNRYQDNIIFIQHIQKSIGYRFKL